MGQRGAPIIRLILVIERGIPFCLSGEMEGVCWSGVGCIKYVIVGEYGDLWCLGDDDEGDMGYIVSLCI